MTENRCDAPEPLKPRIVGPAAEATSDLVSDDDRSMAADSWSIMSDYGSNIEDEQRQVDATEVLSSGNFPPIPDYSSDKEVPDAEEDETQMMGLQSYWDTTYAEDLANFNERGHAGEIWFGQEVTDAIATWIEKLCVNIHEVNESESSESDQGLSSISVLDIGTGNGLFLHQLSKQGFSDLTGTDYSEGAIELAEKLAARDGFSSIKFIVDDILESKLDRKYQLVMDKGTLDSIGMDPDAPVKRMEYWESVSNLVAPGGILVITSLNSTKDELLQEAETLNLKTTTSKESEQEEAEGETLVFQYLDHLESTPTEMFGEAEGSRVSAVAFLRK